MLSRITTVGLLGAALALGGCGGGGGDGAAQGDAGAKEEPRSLQGAVEQISADRDLSPKDVKAALKTYQPSGRKDEYIMFASGGHSGQVFVIGMPSMRLLREIGVFTPEPWQGYGYGTGREIIHSSAGQSSKEASAAHRVKSELEWGDTHHPALSETDGDYDGKWLFINDKANARVATLSLKDFETKQTVKNPIAMNDHGGTFVTPDTEYVIEGGQYAAPLGWSYAPLDEYKERYRGMVTLWKFDRDKGRIDADRSFALELPPYWQDLSDAGKGVSDGWLFMNSFNTEQAKGGSNKGNAPFEAGASKSDTDYLHVIDWEKAERLYEEGEYKEVKGFPVIPLDTLIEEGVLYFVPEPKSPHGVDVAPKGNYVVISGKLDPSVTVYSFKKMQRAIENENWTKDEYGVPVLDQDAVTEARVKVGLGPLHTQFGPDGYAYTSLFLDSQVARWTLGGPYSDGTPEKDWTVAAKTSIHYNVGHVAVAGGDTRNPDGEYLVSLNKWSKDRFFHPGPLLPQNFQLLDISRDGKKMPLLYDMPIGNGEPHYAQIVDADKLDPWSVYPERGWDPEKQAIDEKAPVSGEERIERDGDTVEVFMTARRSHYKPEHVKVEEGDKVIWHVTNVERAVDATHGFSLPGYNVNVSLEPSETQTIELVADRPGTYSYYCSEFCSALHLEMAGYFLVEPKGEGERTASAAQ